MSEPNSLPETQTGRRLQVRYEVTALSGTAESQA